ncbi:hypothetical protein [Lentzea albidocapillata]|uniref:Uncharacterized protein n=1 Tax=Lentzea albidocapillata TaxID=40571 RepID=A0A1W2DZC9_9PSEU|nr:hypothetical protein [Lentzea albidocapillata]SMD02830.1 hypothetical protein SAMN05660733_03486 [Lentzea albidocapillata]
MRVFAITVLVVALGAFGAVVWVASSFRLSPDSRAEPVMPTPSGPQLRRLTVAVASTHGWDVISNGEQVVGDVRNETGTCADPFHSLKVPLPHSGRTRVTLDVQPEPQQQLVITAIRLEVNALSPPYRKAKYLYHCAGPAAPPATRVRVDTSRSAVYPVEGSFPLQVPADGHRQDIEVEVHGEKAAGWQIEVDYILDGVARTQRAPTPRPLVTEPLSGAAGHTVWCDRRWRPGERC